MTLELSPRLKIRSELAKFSALALPRAPTVQGQLPIGGASKRQFDICLALISLIALSPLFLLVALAIKATDPGPIFFRHRRIGNNGVPFDCLKFRTMHSDGHALLDAHLRNNPEAQQEWAKTRKLKNDPRVTVIGEFLRKTSLDELPQIVNILLGEMSVVGPRPVVADEIELYGADAQHYLATRPGLTGAWQVSGRNDVTYSERVRLDRDYVANWSLTTDVVLILRTVPAVFMARGSY